MIVETVELGQVRGIGDSLLDERDVFFLVPPVVQGPGGPG